MNRPARNTLLRMLPVACLALPSAAPAADQPYLPQSYLPSFDSAIDAQQRCPYDSVVYIKSQAAVQRYRGQAKNSAGGYVCMHEAINAGYGGLITHLSPTSPPPAKQPPANQR